MEGVIVAKIEPIGMERLEGTQTFENINRALMDEAISVVRYLIYADKAEDAMVEKFFKQTAENEISEEITVSGFVRQGYVHRFYILTL